ncbi:hypothetical protein FGO68_gene3509 [Halteria grandinella]|uniref:C2H2-type domain-containing protein n=1 Tax=Halteria grandinella TaxID=5974 RepID=A0A8J8SU06_HALGN|nr:hypothetical protein FGO68_gene3509 [Halteria grandinella]
MSMHLARHQISRSIYGSRVEKAINLKTLFTPRPQPTPQQALVIKPVEEPVQTNITNEEEKEQLVSADEILAAFTQPNIEIQNVEPQPTPAKKNQCPICFKEMSTGFNLKKHMKVVHSDAPKKYLKHIKKDKNSFAKYAIKVSRILLV